MTNDLPALGSVRECHKCGEHYTYGPPKAGESYQSNEPGMEWHPGGITSQEKMQNIIPGMAVPLCCYGAPEHISRYCLICGFRWAEAIFQPDQMELPE